jgi:hypothetical protein
MGKSIWYFQPTWHEMGWFCPLLREIMPVKHIILESKSEMGE